MIHGEGRLTLEQGTTINALLAGLRESEARLRDGRPVANGLMAVQWLLEGLSDTGQAEGKALARAEEEARLVELVQALTEPLEQALEALRRMRLSRETE
jgi:hypothetical protein